MARKNRPILYEVAKRQGKSAPNNRPTAPEPPDAKASPRPPVGAAPPVAPKPAPPAAPKPAPPEVRPESKPPPPVAAPEPTRSSPLAPGPIKSGPDGTPIGSHQEPTSKLQFWVLVGAGGVILLFIAFALGQRFMTPSQPDVPVTPILDGGTMLASDVQPPTGAPAPAAAPAPEEVDLLRGYHYVVVQYFPISKQQAADDAAWYLMQNGVPCAILAGKDLRLIASEGFLIRQDDARAGRREQQRADRLVTRIKELGKAYRLQGGYDFSGAAPSQVAGK